MGATRSAAITASFVARAQHFALAIAVVAGGVACSAPAAPSVRAGPTPAGPQPPEPALAGEIAVSSMNPAPGGRLAVWDCDSAGPMSLYRPAHATGMCTDRFRATVDVRVERDVPDAKMEILFRDARGAFCAYGDSYRTTLRAGVPTSFVVEFLNLSEYPAIPALCAPLPVTTTSMAVVLDGAYTGARLMREFSHTFLFELR